MYLARDLPRERQTIGKPQKFYKNGTFTFHISSSEYSPIGSMLLLTVPSKRIGSWGMIPNRDLRSWRPIVEMSMPSMIILPPEGSTSLKKTWIRVDFPLPVRPTTPIFSPPRKLRVTPLRTRGVFGRYLTCPPCSSKYPYQNTFQLILEENDYLTPIMPIKKPSSLTTQLRTF